METRNVELLNSFYILLSDCKVLETPQATLSISVFLGLPVEVELYG